MKTTIRLISIVVVMTCVGFVWSKSADVRSNVARSARIESSHEQRLQGDPPVGVSAAASPKVLVVGETEYDFGTMDPLQRGSYEFVVRNVGAAPLELRKGETTCKCTISTVAGDAIPPGGEGKVRLDWLTSPHSGFYSQGTLVHTNDPATPAVELRVAGSIYTRLGFYPPKVVFSDLRPGASTTADVVMYSQHWDSIDIGEITSTIDGASWTVSPAEEDICKALDARCAYRLSIDTPPMQSPGTFRGELQLEASPGGLTEGGPNQYELALEGKVLGFMGVYGPAVDSEGTVHLGHVPAGRGAVEQLTIRVLDDNPTLHVRRISVSPDFLNVSVEPYTDEASAPGLYRLRLEIPPDAPAVAMLGVHLGEIEIETDHPKLPILKLNVSLAVVEDGETLSMR